MVLLASTCEASPGPGDPLKGDPPRSSEPRSLISPGEKAGPEALVQSLSGSGFGGQAAEREDLTSTGEVQNHPITSLLVA